MYSVNADCYAPNQPRLYHQSLVVWFDLEQSLMWCECMASQAETKLVHVVWARCRTCLSTTHMAALALQCVAICLLQPANTQGPPHVLCCTNFQQTNTVPVITLYLLYTAPNFITRRYNCTISYTYTN